MDANEGDEQTVRFSPLSRGGVRTVGCSQDGRFVDNRTIQRSPASAATRRTMMVMIAAKTTRSTRMGGISGDPKRGADRAPRHMQQVSGSPGAVADRRQRRPRQSR
jgi:hypothetical protein